MKPIHRRQFLASAAAFAVGPVVSGLEPLVRRGSSRLRLSLAAYSFREYFRDTPQGPGPKSAGGQAMDLPAFIDFCGAHGCAGCELTAYYFPKDVTSEFLLQLRRQAFLSGVAVSGTAVGNTFTPAAGARRDREVAQVKQWIENARILGAPHIRVFAGNLEGQPMADAKRNCIEALEECGEAAGRAGVFLGIENHGGIVAEPGDLIEIVRAVRSPWVGINLDSGNFHSADPYADFARCVPYAVNVQIKVEIRRGAAKPEPTDLDKVVGSLRQGNYQGWVALEYEAAEDPYVAVPRHLKEIGRRLREEA